MQSGKRLGFSKVLPISTVEQAIKSSKPERTEIGKDGESYYILPEGQTEVISGK